MYISGANMYILGAIDCHLYYLSIHELVEMYSRCNVKVNRMCSKAYPNKVKPNNVHVEPWISCQFLTRG